MEKIAVKNVTNWPENCFIAEGYLNETEKISIGSQN